VSPRAPKDIVRPRRSAGVVVRPLNFTVRAQWHMVAPRTVVLVFSAIAIFAVSAVARSDAGGHCRLTDQEFFAQLPTLHDWKGIYAFYKRNLPACPDDGAYAEGYSDVIVRAFAKRWTDVAHLQTLAVADPGFRAFVLRHIDATGDPDELRETLQNATTRCPAGVDALCKDVAANAAGAIREL